METIESILTSVKKLLGIDESYTHFDPDLIMHINSVFSILTQIGVGPANGFSITGKGETWSKFIKEDSDRFSLVKSYMHLIESINRQISEFEWRLSVAADPAGDKPGEEETQNG